MYCRSLNTVADVHGHFLYTMGANSYHPPGAEQVSDNRLFGMYHANTVAHNKVIQVSHNKVIQISIQDPHGVVHITFATVALGMGVTTVTSWTEWGYQANYHLSL